MTTTDILITGATGNVGREVIAAFPERNRLRAAVRDTRKSVEAGIATVAFDFERPETFGPAFEGIRKIFLVRPPAISDVPKHITPAIEAARAAGVEHIVFLSLQGVEKNPIVPHHKIEKAIMAAGIPHTFLRASFFMQNLSTTHRAEIRDTGEIVVPAGGGRTSFIDVRDIAAVAVKALAENGHENKAYTLTGAEALTYDKVAAILSDNLGRDIQYRRPSILRFARHNHRMGRSAGMILVMTALYSTARFGMADGLTSDTADLLGRPPISLRQFAQDYRAVWANHADR